MCILNAFPWSISEAHLQIDPGKRESFLVDCGTKESHEDCLMGICYVVCGLVCNKLSLSSIKPSAMSTWLTNPLE